jgi:hypothetical protein
MTACTEPAACAPASSLAAAAASHTHNDATVGVDAELAGGGGT